MVSFTYTRRVFISHAEEDTEIAQNISNLLKNRLNIDVQIDKNFLHAGNHWLSVVEEEMKKSEVVIVLFSRLVAQDGSEGVLKEIQLAHKNNIPVIKGLIRQQQAYDESQFINFGEKGDREMAIWEVARFLLNKSTPFSPIGLAGFYKNKGDIPEDTECIADLDCDIIVIGHTLKAWFGDYGNLIRFGKARIKTYFPSSKDAGLPLLKAIHRSGNRIMQDIKESKRRAIALAKEINDPDRFQCYELQIKPMFSAMVVNPNKENGYISIDHYIFRISTENRPKFIIKGLNSPLYKLYWQVIQQLIENAKPLTNV